MTTTSLKEKSKVTLKMRTTVNLIVHFVNT